MALVQLKYQQISATQICVRYSYLRLKTNTVCSATCRASITNYEVFSTLSLFWYFKILINAIINKLASNQQPFDIQTCWNKPWYMSHSLILPMFFFFISPFFTLAKIVLFLNEFKIQIDSFVWKILWNEQKQLFASFCKTKKNVNKKRMKFH